MFPVLESVFSTNSDQFIDKKCACKRAMENFHTITPMFFWEIFIYGKIECEKLLFCKNFYLKLVFVLGEVKFSSVSASKGKRIYSAIYMQNTSWKENKALNTLPTAASRMITGYWNPRILCLFSICHQNVHERPPVDRRYLVEFWGRNHVCVNFTKKARWRKLSASKSTKKHNGLCKFDKKLYDCHLRS